MTKKKSNTTLFITICIFTIALAAVVLFGYNFVMSDINGERKNDAENMLIIQSNDYEYEVGQMLYNNHIIKSDIVWTNWMSKHYPDFTYINGEYLMNSHMSYEEIVQKLQNPDISHKSVKVCIPEGYNCMEIAKTLEENNICSAEAFLEVCKSTEDFQYDWLDTVPDSPLIAYKLEGFLFPATYSFAMNSEPYEIAEEMLNAFDERITADMTDFCEQNNMTMFELITLASVVQEEAFGVNSAGKIASVFINRLNKGAKLQSDVTYFYARDLRDDYGFSQEVYDAYYTYRCEGLPAGPVTNSGEDIVNAVINHPDTDYLYFYSDLEKEFHFAKTYDEFVSLQEKYPWK